MSALPPLPWSYETSSRYGEHDGKGFVFLLDANGRKIGTVWGKPEEKIAIIQMIIDASDMMHALDQAIEQSSPPRLLPAVK